MPMAESLPAAETTGRYYTVPQADLKKLDTMTEMCLSIRGPDIA